MVAALAAIAVAAASLAVASGQDRNDLVPPSVAVGRDGLATVAWTEVARPGIRVAQQSAPGRWSRPVLLSSTGGPGSVGVGRDGRAHVAFTGPQGLVVADQARGAGRGEPPIFRQRVLDRRAVGRPSIAESRRGDLAIAYQTQDGPLRIALRGRSGEWRTESLGISAEQPKLAANRKGFVFAGLRQGAVVLGRVDPRRPAGAPRGGGVVRAPDPIRSFGLAIAGGQTLIPYIEERQQVVMTASPDQLDSPAAVSAIIAGVGNSTAAAGTPAGRAVVLSRNPRYHVLSLALLQGTARLGDLTVDQGQEGDVAITGNGRQAFVAYWDYPGGRQLHVARVPLVRGKALPTADLLPITPILTPARIAGVSVTQHSLPSDGKAAIWLAALALLLTILAGGLLLYGHRPGIRFLPFAVALGLLGGFAVRGAYLAQLGAYGLPPNDLLTLDRSGVDAVVDALLIVAGATAVICLAGRLLPAGLGSGVLGRLKAVQLPGSRAAVRVAALFGAVSLAIGLYVLGSNGFEELSKSRQTAFAGSGYKLALLYAGAGAWLVCFAASGWPRGRRDQALLAALGCAALLPLVISGTRSAAIFGFIVPILLLIHLRVRPIRPRTAIIFLACLFVVAIGMRQAFRGDAPTPVPQRAPNEDRGGRRTSPRFLKPALGWTEAAAFDGFVLVRTQYMPRFGTDPGLTPAPSSAFPCRGRSGPASREVPWTPSRTASTLGSTG